MRLITNPEKMVLRETQRAFVYFSLHGLTVDTVIVNRVLPSDISDRWFSEWHSSQDRIIGELEEYFVCAAGAHRLTRGGCNEAGGQRNGPRLEWCSKNASERGVPVTACERELGRRPPEPRDYATRDTLVDWEGPRVYKSAYLDGQNGNSDFHLSQASLSVISELRGIRT